MIWKLTKSRRACYTVVMSIKDGILSRLYAGEASGEKLAEELGVTRAAVWKAIKQLGAEGYGIASSRRGYRLVSGDKPSAAGVRHFFGGEMTVEAYKTLPSTNDRAKTLAESGAPCAAVVADAQSNGRGRLGRSFVSPRGSGLYLSALIRPELSAADCGRITAYAAVVAARAIEELGGVKADIKWVNDIYIGGRKVCGILTEGGFGMENGRLAYAVVGIGVNVHAAAFPPEIASRATSIEEAGGRYVDRCELAACLLRGLADTEEQVRSGAFVDEYRRRSCVIGKRVTVDGRYDALVTGIADDCSLLIDVGGEEKTFSAGEVSLAL